MNENEVLHVKPILRLLTSYVCACLLTACLAAPDEGGAPLEAQALAAGSDDSHSQGTELHGTPLRTASYSGASVLHGGARRSATLRLDRGELVADMPLMVSGTTPSLQSCFLRASGPERSCGFVVEGQGLCKPKSTVILVSGACDYEPGSCTGKPVVRICSDEQPCEHERTGYLATGGYSCLSTCPTVKFVCPSSGIYTVLAAPYTSGQSWSLDLVASDGGFPATSKELRGRQLVGARMLTQPGASTGTILEVVDAINAANVPIPESPGIWDSSGDTFLYHVRYGPSYGPYTTELCTAGATGADPNGAWAVPVRGVFDLQGGRQDSTTQFTLGCHQGVIAKCYRWGYKPWMDGSQTGTVTRVHQACTRMARADYCGNGTSYTQDGTRIRPWDDLVPAIIAAPAPDAGTPGMSFEAAWKTSGPSCLSHWRWKNLTASCVQLTPPLYGSDGGIRNDCRDPNREYSTAGCSQICDTPEEAALHYDGRLFNNSAVNGLDGGTGP